MRDKGEPPSTFSSLDAHLHTVDAPRILPILQAHAVARGVNQKGVDKNHQDLGLCGGVST